MKRAILRPLGVVPIVFICFFLIAGCAARQSPPPNPVTAPPGASPGGPSQPTSNAGPHPNFYDFPDVPVPSELSRYDSDSFVFQSGQLKAGLMVLRGARVEVASVISFFQMAMPREGWKPKGGFSSGRTLLIFEKPDKTCVIILHASTIYTWVDVYVAPHSES